jgi:DNA-binding response OmpR family regulator
LDPHLGQHQEEEVDAMPALVAEPARLLLVDDDAELRDLIGTYLRRQGFAVSEAVDAVEMDARLASEPFDLLLLDLMLPGENGLSIAKRLKSTCNLPIIMLSAQGEDVDRIVGLEVGADDYLGKPFNPRELLARIRAVLRRTARLRDAPAAEPAQSVRFGPFVLDLRQHRLLRDHVPVVLTTGEFELLRVFAQHPNRVLDRDRILDLLTGGERSPFDRSIDVRVTRLRTKLHDNSEEPRWIRTVWGKGYMFCPDHG